MKKANLKPKFQLTLEPYERDHAVVMGVYRPSAKSKKVGKLHFNTEDGPPEIYLALQEYTNGADIDWVQIRIPGRPNGRKGWVPREGVGEFAMAVVLAPVPRVSAHACAPAVVDRSLRSLAEQIEALHAPRERPADAPRKRGR